VNAQPLELVPPEPDDDRARFEALVRRHHDRLRRFANALLVDRARVDDVLQEAYVKTYRARPTFANVRHESAWLHRVVHRCCLDELRRVGRSRETPFEVVEPRGATPDASRALLVDEAWRALSDADRSVLLLIDVAGFDYSAAARILRVPRGTVASRLSVARDRLRRRIEHE
jgi:RNA polymerase sigma-70 factor (ECF subfamily)